MTLRARRFYYSSAILVFFIAAPLVIATAAGWRWTGWRQGFVQTGTLLVTGSERLSVALNGTTVGSTPQRITGLTPGVYQLALSRSGDQSWAHVVTITPRTTTKIGPVRLFPKKLATTIIRPEQFDGFLTDPATQSIAGWTKTATGSSLQVLWPKILPTTLSLPETPTWVRLSPRQQHLAVGTASSTLIFSLPNSTTPRTLPVGDPVAWLNTSENITYRLEAGQLMADDELTETRLPIATANSAIIADESIWSATQTSDTTAIYQHTGATSARPKLITTLNGRWDVQGLIGRAIVVRELSDDTAMLVKMNRLSGRIEQLLLGELSSIKQSQSEQVPLWTRGADLLTLSSEQEPIVLLRSTEDLLDSAWITPEHIIATVNPSALSIRSVSVQQGRSVLLTQEFTAQQKPLLLDASNSSILVDNDGRLERWQWK